jgi:hypothetical protein
MTPPSRSISYSAFAPSGVQQSNSIPSSSFTPSFTDFSKFAKPKQESQESQAMLFNPVINTLQINQTGEQISTTTNLQSIQISAEDYESKNSLSQSAIENNSLQHDSPSICEDNSSSKEISRGSNGFSRIYQDVGNGNNYSSFNDNYFPTYDKAYGSIEPPQTFTELEIHDFSRQAVETSGISSADKAFPVTDELVKENLHTHDDMRSDTCRPHSSMSEMSGIHSLVGGTGASPGEGEESVEVSGVWLDDEGSSPPVNLSSTAIM